MLACLGNIPSARTMRRRFLADSRQKKMVHLALDSISRRKAPSAYQKTLIARASTFWKDNRECTIKNRNRQDHATTSRLRVKPITLPSLAELDRRLSLQTHGFLELLVKYLALPFTAQGRGKASSCRILRT